MTPLQPQSYQSSIEIPFILNQTNLEFDKIVIFLVAVLLAITVNAEAQAFMATVLGDSRQDSRDRFHFNPFLHIDLAGFIAFFVAGFGWAKQIDLDIDRFKNPSTGVILVKFGGAFANLMLAGIAGSILFVMKKWNLEDQVFTIVVAVNVMMFVFNFIPIPPLAGGSLIGALLPSDVRLDRICARSSSENIQNGTIIFRYFARLFPYVLLGALIFMRAGGVNWLDQSTYPFVRIIFHFIAG